MCGIFGTISRRSVDKRKIEDSLDLLRHRGPDDRRIRSWGEVTFGFTRLSIQDLTESGAQPMTHPNKPIHIVFNGEIYNYKVLREELRAEGAVFRSSGDTEVILHCYHLWGWEKTLQRMEGMFGLALFDEGKKVVYFARDRFGQKPLFYSQANGDLIFSSEIKAIIKYRGGVHFDYSSSLNPLFTTGLPPRGKTMFEGISQLEEGQYLKYDIRQGTSQMRKYFSIFDWVSESTYNELSKYSYSQIIDTYNEAFHESIKKHLVSDAPLASLFSAGLDSSLITAIAAKYKRVDLYHFESELTDMLKYPKFFSEKYKLKLKIEKGQDRNYIFNLPRMIYHYETINKEEGPVLGNLCRLARQDGVKVLLTGDVSDELFGGYPSHETFLIRDSLYCSKILRKIFQGINKFFPNNITQFRPENPLGTHYTVFPSGENFHEVSSNCLLHKGARLGEWKRCLDAYSFVGDERERHVSAYLLDDINYRIQRFMIRADRFGMMESVELRLPFLDPAIVKLAINTPLKWRMKKKTLCRGYEGKFIVKELAIRHGMPHWYSCRKKMATPHNSSPQVTKILRNWPLKNLSDFLKISLKDLKEISLSSFDPDLYRIQYAFLSMEILMRIFSKGDSCEMLEEELKGIMQGEKLECASN